MKLETMDISFTGTSDDMSEIQKSKLFSVLIETNKITPITESHDGDCIGSDKTFHIMMMEHFPDAKRHSHPCTIEWMRAHCERFDKDTIIHKTKLPLVRNHDIVNDGKDKLFATPKGEEIVRSGTWATIRYAKKQKRSIHIIYPDGREEMIRGE